MDLRERPAYGISLHYPWLGGLCALALAVVSGWWPGAAGVGPYWSLTLLTAGALVAVQELRVAGARIPSVLAALPDGLLHPLLGPVLTGAVSLHAVLRLDLSLVSALWLLAAGLLCRWQAREGRLPALLRERFDLRLAWFGYRRYLALGATVCLLSLFFAWGQTPGTWFGGYDYRWDVAQGRADYVYNPAVSYTRGQRLPGRSQPLAFFAAAAVLGLVAWAAYPGEGTQPVRYHYVGAALALFLMVWWLPHAGRHFGPWLFFSGLCGILVGVVMVWRGEHEGRFDPAHLLQRRRR